jgi:hypothetical protein
MSVSHSTTHRTVVAAAVLVSVAGLVACGSQQDPASAGTVTRLNEMEHEARRHLVEVRAEQASALNPREHLAHQKVDEGASVSSAKVSSACPVGMDGLAALMRAAGLSAQAANVATQPTRSDCLAASATGR